jgi:outer membrane scaffolding protein for murein synthesis (MipA/OmpV family)
MKSAARVATLILTSSCALAPLPAAAWGSLLLIDKPPETRSLAIGPSLWTMPSAPGSKSSRALVIPGVDYYAPSGFFASTDVSVGWNLAHSDALQAGVRVWPQFGREPHDTPYGVNSIGDRLQVEGFANYQVLSALLLQSGLSYGSGRRHDGGQLELGMTSGVPIGRDLLAIGVATTYANHAYRQSYFGVSAAEAANSGLAATTVPYGWQDVSLTFSGEHRLSAHWRIDGQLIAARLTGAAERSPLTQSRTQLAGTLTLWRDF